MIHALHGNFGLPSDWEAALPPGVPAKAWHLWEIRRQHPEARTLTGFAAWFNNQIAALPPDPSRILAGYSLGGRLALHVIADRPELWRGVMILSAHPGLDSEAAREERLRQDLAWQDRCLHLPWDQLADAWNSQPVLQSSGGNASVNLLEPWRGEIASAFADWSLGRQQAMPRGLPVEGLWLAGGADSKFRELAEAAGSSDGGFEVSVIPQAGHRLLTTHADEVRRHLERLLPHDPPP